MTAGMAPVRSPSREWDETGIRLHVFVAGLIAAGALMSLLVGLTESIGSTRGKERLRRRAAPAAEMMVTGVVSGYGSARASSVGLRRRGDYLVIAAILVVIGALPVIAAADDFLSDDANGLLIWAVAFSTGLTLLAVAAVFVFAALRYPRVPSLVRRIAPARPRAKTTVWAVIPEKARWAIYSMMGVVAVLGGLVVAEEEVLLSIDEPLYFDWLEASGGVDRWTPEWVSVLGQAEWVIPISIVIGLVLLRHRVIAIAFPAVIVIGGVANLLVSWITHRLRPPLSGHAGEFTSFPSGHSIQVTLLMGILPLAVFVLTERKWIAGLVGVGAVALWAAAWADVLRTGGHWPTDQLAGLLIGISLLVVVYAVAFETMAKRRLSDDQVLRDRD